MNNQNGSNNHNVSFSCINFLNRILTTHSNIQNINRTNDILFTITRRNQEDVLKILCLNEYVMSIDKTLEVLEEFGALNIIYIGASWNHYSSEAKSYCISNQIGLFVPNEMTGALFKNDYWNYHQTDKEGNPIYFGGTPQFKHNQ